MSKHENFIKENQDWLARVGYWVLIVFFVTLMVMGVLWGIWELYTWVVPSLFPTGPKELINPSYLVFSGAWLLFIVIGRWVFRRK